MINQINVRVYACVVKDQKVLTLYEQYAGKPLLKFPGGGLELGEGLADCLHREFEEELNLKIEIIEHFYTQDSFLVSLFDKSEQLLTIYYTAKILNEEKLVIKDSNIHKVDWFPLDSSENPFTLPIDRIVFEKLQKKFL